LSAVPAPTENATEFAIEQKTKLKKSLRRFDMVFFTLCALVGLDTLGTVSSNGPEGIFWLVLLALLFVGPYMLLMSEVGSTFTEEGGPYEWIKMAFGRLQGGIAAVVYWASNPFWVGGSLAFTASVAWQTSGLPALGINHLGTAGDYIFKLLFIWFSIIVAIVSIEKGKWIPNAGAFARIFVLGFFTLTLVIYAVKHGLHHFAFGQMSPSLGVLFALVPLILFNYVGFELQNGAAEEMVNPQRDVPVSVLRSGLLGVILYCVPIIGIVVVLPASAITGLGGFVDAVKETFTVYGSASGFLFDITVLGFIFTLMTSGAVWMIGADRVVAVSAADGAFFPFFGVFNKRFGTPVRVNLLSGITSSVFMIAAVSLLRHGSTADAFTVVLDMATSTTLLAYLWIFTASLKLRYVFPDLHRPYRVPGKGNSGIWIATLVVMFWTVLGSWVALFPGTLEKLFGVSYGFRDTWGVSRLRFEGLTLGTLAIMFLIAILGYAAGSGVRKREVAVPVEAPA
jgi:amino acid transporter